MKTLTIAVLMICFVMIPVFAQQNEATKKTPEEIKALEDKLEKQAKDNNKANKDKAKTKNTSNKFEVVAQFPEQFVGQTLRFKDVPVTIEGITKDGTTTYYAEFYSPKWKRFTTNREAGTITFILTSEMGHGVTTFFREYASNNQIRTNVTVDLNSESANGQTFYLANVTCIELLGVFGQKFKKIGNCQ